MVYDVSFSDMQLYHVDGTVIWTISISREGLWENTLPILQVNKLNVLIVMRKHFALVTSLSLRRV